MVVPFCFPISSAQDSLLWINHLYVLIFWKLSPRLSFPLESMNQVVLVLLFYAAGLAQGSGEPWLSICRNEELGGFLQWLLYAPYLWTCSQFCYGFCSLHTPSLSFQWQLEEEKGEMCKFSPPASNRSSLHSSNDLFAMRVIGCDEGQVLKYLLNSTN